MKKKEAQELINKVAQEQRAQRSAVCPRCGIARMEKNLEDNTVSHHADVHICAVCGTQEALMLYCGTSIHLTDWADVKGNKATHKLSSEQILKLEHLRRRLQTEHEMGPYAILTPPSVREFERAYDELATIGAFVTLQNPISLALEEMGFSIKSLKKGFLVSI